jgi:hypothetical protein
MAQTAQRTASARQVGGWEAKLLAPWLFEQKHWMLRNGTSLPSHAAEAS